MAATGPPGSGENHDSTMRTNNATRNTVRSVQTISMVSALVGG